MRASTADGAMTGLTGRRALVTGGGTGIGRAVALALAAAGADVALTYRTHDAAPVAAQVRALGRSGAAFVLDATDPAQVEDVVGQAAEALGGPVDVLVNNAGGLVARRALDAMEPDHWRAVLDLNLTSAYLVSRAVLRTMPDGGAVVNVSSLAGQDGGGPGAVAYAAAKAGLDGFTRGLAKEVAARRIRVTSVAPGFVDETPFHQQHNTPEGRRAAAAGTLVGRGGTPDDVAAAVVYLAGAGFVTGAVLDLNGGTHLR